MKKNLLKEQYARLFKGKSSSNDASLITEAPITEASIKVLSHGENHYKKLIFTLKANGKMYKVATGDTDYAEWHYMDDQNQNISPSQITRDPKDVFRTIEKYVKDNEDEINRVYGMDKYTGLTSMTTGTQGPLKIYGPGPGKIKVKDHDDMRERDPELESGFEGELEFEGTWNGEKWTATKEYLGDGAIFTTVYDANGDNVEDESIEAYEDIIDAINDYMGEQNLNESKRTTKKPKMLKEQYAKLFKGKPMSNDGKLLREEVEYFDEPVSTWFKGDLGTAAGLPVESITLHYWGSVVNLNAHIEGAEDYYGDDSVIEQLQDTVAGLTSKPEYRNWIKEIETMGHHSAREIGSALDAVEYTESGMNQDGDVSTEYHLD
jgi:hypothetical protein